MAKNTIVYPEVMKNYVEALNEKSIYYSAFTIECALKNCYKQLLKKGFDSFTSFHDYLLTFNPDTDKRFPDCYSSLDLELKISRKSNPSVFILLMNYLSEERQNEIKIERS